LERERERKRKGRENWVGRRRACLLFATTFGELACCLQYLESVG
jgi:hypothetical protein